MSSPVDPVKQKAASLVRGYSPALDAGTTGKTGLAKAGQVVKNLTGKVSARFTRLMILASEGKKVTNASIIDKIKRQAPEPMIEPAVKEVGAIRDSKHELKILENQLTTLQASTAAWKHLEETGLGKEELDRSKRSNPFAQTEQRLNEKIEKQKEKVTQEIDAQLDKVDTIQKGNTAVLGPTHSKDCCDKIKRDLEGEKDLTKRAEIIKKGLEPLEKIREDRDTAEHMLKELEEIPEAELTNRQKQVIADLRRDMQNLKTNFDQINAAYESSGEADLQEELEYTQVFLGMQQSFQTIADESDKNLPKLAPPNPPAAAPAAGAAPVAANPPAAPANPPAANPPAAPVNPPAAAAPDAAAANPPAAPAAAPAAPPMSPAELQAGQQKLEADKIALEAEKQKVEAEKQALDMERKRLAAERKKLEEQYVKDSVAHIRSEFSQLSSLETNYSPYDEHGSRGSGSGRKKYLTEDVLKKHPALQESHKAYQKQLEQRTDALHVRAHEFIQQHPNEFYHRPDVLAYKEQVELHWQSKASVTAHTKAHMRSQSTEMPPPNPFAEFVLWEQEKDKTSRMALAMSERLAESGSTRHQAMLATDHPDPKERKNYADKARMRTGEPDPQALKEYREKFAPKAAPPPQPPQPQPPPP